jgi:hypothetical protein
MSVIVQRGPWKGHQIRKGRKSHKCDDCKQVIRPGDHYLETEVDPSVDAPSVASGIWKFWRSSRMLPSVRPVMQL